MKRTSSLLLAAAMAATTLVFGATQALAQPDAYVEMSDGIKIAISYRVPEHCGEASGQIKCPTIFEMSGYDGGSSQDGTLSRDIEDDTGLSGLPLTGDSSQLTHHLRDRYVVVHASVRGSGCSGGEFDLFSLRGALDGKEIIDNWIPKQEWSDGNVGIIGHSYGGLTGTLIATTRPSHLRVISVSGLIDDLYRGITYPGGVSNFGFPLLWTGGVRPAYDVGGGLAPGLVRPSAEDENGIREGCANATTTKSRTVLNDPLVQGLSDTDSSWFQARSLINFIDNVEVPIHITGAYQDEQTGPRGPSHLFEKVAAGIDKRLILTNGDHGTNGLYAGTKVTTDRREWLDHYLRGSVFSEIDPSKPVRVYFETSDGVPNGTLDSASFPLTQTQWTTFYGGGAGNLSAASNEVSDGTASYVAGPGRQSWSYQAGPTGGSQFTTPTGPDEIELRGDPLGYDLAIAGPVTALLNLSSTAPDTEVFVQLIDEHPDGERTYLQRGLLKASHRAIQADNSDCVDRATNASVECDEPGALLYRPYRPHVQTQLLTPGTTYPLLVEIFPVGHVFREGHRIVVKIHNPPAVDSYYAYLPKRAPALNTVQLGVGKFELTLPVVAKPTLGPERACGDQDAVRCVPKPFSP